MNMQLMQCRDIDTLQCYSLTFLPILDVLGIDRGGEKAPIWVARKELVVLVKGLQYWLEMW